MRKFNVAGITYCVRDTPELKTARPTGAVTLKGVQFQGDLAVEIWQGGVQLGYVPKASGILSECADAGMGTVTGYKYHHPDWQEMGIPKWNDDHIGELKSVEISVGLEVEPDGEVIGGQYMRVTSFLGYLSTSGTMDNLIRWAYKQGDTFDKYKAALGSTCVAGTSMHDSIEEYFNESGKGNLSHLPEGWDGFVERFEPETCYMEQRFRDNTLMLTGKPDWVGYITHPKTKRRVLAVLDWKSSKAVQLKHRLQLAIYAKNSSFDGDVPEIAMVVAFGSKTNQKYSIGKIDHEQIENYYTACLHLKKVIELAGCPVDKTKYL
jgi:hypothetical protein